MKRVTKSFGIAMIATMVVGCGPSNSDLTNEFNKALDNGKISEAREIIYDIEGYERYHCAEALIEEYIKVGEIDAAINVYERVTPWHCSTYEIQFESLHGHNGYERRVCRSLYEALIEADDFETAWKYHELDYEDPDYAGNGGCYFGYMSDVLIHLCQQGRMVEAQQFLNKHSLWFLKNVDNGKNGQEYAQYSYNKVLQDFQLIINTTY